MTGADEMPTKMKAGSKIFTFVWSPTARSEYDLRTALSEQERSRLTNSAACARDYNDLAFDCRHEVLLSSLRDLDDPFP